MRRSKINEALAMKLYQAGKRDCEIAVVCGVKRGVVFRWRTRNGLDVNGHKPKQAKQPEPKLSKLAATEREARKHGMTYGQWVNHKREESAL